MDTLLMTVSILAVLLGMTREVMRFRKGIYHPFIYSSQAKDDKGILRTLILLLILFPPLFIENQDYKNITYSIILIMLFLWMNLFSWLFVYRLLAKSKKKAVYLTIQTIILNALTIGALIFLN